MEEKPNIAGGETGICRFCGQMVNVQWLRGFEIIRTGMLIIWPHGSVVAWTARSMRKLNSGGRMRRQCGR